MATKQRVEYERVAAPSRGTLARGRSLLDGLPPAELAAGLTLGLVSIAVYATAGYGRPMLLLWLASALILTVHFWATSERLPRAATADLVAPAALMIAFSPLYLAAIYRWPVQVGYDEMTIMGVARRYATTPNLDLFGLSEYFGRPTLLFVPWGKLGEAIGGADLFHMRLVHAGFGLLVLGVSYTLFRQILPRGWAVFAVGVLGFSHAFFMISRLAMRENTAVLMEVAALALLLRGLRHDHAFSTYCGGFVAGLGYYVYQPSRATFPIWALFLVLLAIFYRDTFSPRKLARLGATATVGFVLMAGPVIITESQASPAELGSPYGVRETLLIYPQARDVIRMEGGFRTNVSQGLTTFNNRIADRSYTYVNPGHGFVDPLTGILLWVGAIAVGVGLVRRRRAGPGPLLMLVGFLVLWLSFALLITKAPNYTRLLVTLPFVAYLVTEAVRMLGRVLERGLQRLDPARASRAVAAVAVATLAALAVGNLGIAWDFIDKGRNEGQDLGSTGRYIASHPGEDFFVVADEGRSIRYFTSAVGSQEGWLKQMQPFVRGGTRLGGSVSPDVARGLRAQPPFGLFMNSEVSNYVGKDLARLYPTGRVRNVTPDGRLVVFDVPRGTAP